MTGWPPLSPTAGPGTKRTCVPVGWGSSRERIPIGHEGVEGRSEGVLQLWGVCPEKRVAAGEGSPIQKTVSRWDPLWMSSRLASTAIGRAAAVIYLLEKKGGLRNLNIEGVFKGVEVALDLLVSSRRSPVGPIYFPTERTLREGTERYAEAEAPGAAG